MFKNFWEKYWKIICLLGLVAWLVVTLFMSHSHEKNLKKYKDRTVDIGQGIQVQVPYWIDFAAAEKRNNSSESVPIFQPYLDKDNMGIVPKFIVTNIGKKMVSLIYGTYSHGENPINKARGTVILEPGDRFIIEPPVKNSWHFTIFSVERKE